MRFFCFNPRGYEGGLVSIEVDIRRGLPAIDIVGLAGAAVREARERVRVAIVNSGFEFPLGHIVINLSPADMPKTGSAFDLAIALALCHAADNRQTDAALSEPSSPRNILVMGELTLSGQVRPVAGILPALLEAKHAGISECIIPRGNRWEAAMIDSIQCNLVEDLVQALGHIELKAATSAKLLNMPRVADPEMPSPTSRKSPGGGFAHCYDESVFAQQPLLLLSLLAAAAGRHHVLMYGSPGVGKTMALRYLGEMLPEPSETDLLEVNRLYSLAGQLQTSGGLVNRAPVRVPHHESSTESLIGGGKHQRPGELSLAHHGLLILDEAPEFRKDVIQSLREPMEEGLIRIGRADGLIWFPASFMLGMSLNPCPCGQLGSGHGRCACSSMDVQRYWGRIGSPVLDRIDIRLRIGSEPHNEKVQNTVGVDWRNLPIFSVEPRLEILRDCIRSARNKREIPNGMLRGTQVNQVCVLDTDAQELLALHEQKTGSGMRTRHGLLRLARTIADLNQLQNISSACLLAAFCMREPIQPAPGMTIM